MGADLRAGVRAACLLACGHAEGLRLLPDDPDGVTRSFVSAFLCVPLFVALRALAWEEVVPEPALLRALSLDLLLFAIGWAGFLIVSQRVAAFLGRAARWPRYVAAWNWTNAAQYVLLLAAALLGDTGAPEWLVQLAHLVVFGWALWIEYFTARSALDLGPPEAAMLVGIDVGIGIVLALIAASLNLG